MEMGSLNPTRGVMMGTATPVEPATPIAAALGVGVYAEMAKSAWPMRFAMTGTLRMGIIAPGIALPSSAPAGMTFSKPTRPVTTETPRRVIIAPRIV